MPVIVREGQAVVLHYSDNWYLKGKVSGLNKIACLTGFKRGLGRNYIDKLTIAVGMGYFLTEV